jgi:integral membrane protein
MPAEAAAAPSPSPSPSENDARARRISSGLARFQIIAYTVGVGLLLLCVATVLDLGYHQPKLAEVVGPLHGFLYMVYLGLGIDLALKARWSIPGTVLILLAGTVPFASFVAERQVSRRMRDGRGL